MPKVDEELRDERTGVVVCERNAYRTSIPVAIGDRVLVGRAIGEPGAHERIVTGFDTDYCGEYGWSFILKVLKRK